MNGTVAWNGVYGPSAGQVVSQNTGAGISGGNPLDRLPLTLPVIVCIGFLAWWALEKWD